MAFIVTNGFVIVNVYYQYYQLMFKFLFPYINFHMSQNVKKKMVVYLSCYSQAEKFGTINAKSIRNKLYASDPIQNNLI